MMPRAMVLGSGTAVAKLKLLKPIVAPLMDTGVPVSEPSATVPVDTL